MNAKKAKRIRQRLRASGYDPGSSEHIAGPERGPFREPVTGQVTLQPECGRSIYRRIKQLGIE